MHHFVHHFLLESDAPKLSSIMKDKDFAGRLKQLRKSRNLKQTEAAQSIGISYSALQDHEGGQWPNRNNLKKYIDFYNCDEVWLKTGQGEPYPGEEDASVSTPQYNKVSIPEPEPEPESEDDELRRVYTELMGKYEDLLKNYGKLELKNELLTFELKELKASMGPPEDQAENL